MWVYYNPKAFPTANTNFVSTYKFFHAELKMDYTHLKRTMLGNDAPMVFRLPFVKYSAVAEFCDHSGHRIRGTR